MNKVKNFIIKYVLPLWVRSSIWYLTKRGYTISKNT